MLRNCSKGHSPFTRSYPCNPRDPRSPERGCRVSAHLCFCENGTSGYLLHPTALIWNFLALSRTLVTNFRRGRSQRYYYTHWRHIFYVVPGLCFGGDTSRACCWDIATLPNTTLSCGCFTFKGGFCQAWRCGRIHESSDMPISPSLCLESTRSGYCSYRQG